MTIQTHKTEDLVFASSSSADVPSSPSARLSASNTLAADPATSTDTTAASPLPVPPAPLEADDIQPDVCGPSAAKVPSATMRSVVFHLHESVNEKALFAGEEGATGPTAALVAGLQRGVAEATAISTITTEANTAPMSPPALASWRKNQSLKGGFGSSPPPTREIKQMNLTANQLVFDALENHLVGIVAFGSVADDSLPGSSAKIRQQRVSTGHSVARARHPRTSTFGETSDERRIGVFETVLMISDLLTKKLGRFVNPKVLYQVAPSTFNSLEPSLTLAPSARLEEIMGGIDLARLSYSAFAAICKPFLEILSAPHTIRSGRIGRDNIRLKRGYFNPEKAADVAAGRSRGAATSGRSQYLTKTNIHSPESRRIRTRPKLWPKDWRRCERDVDSLVFLTHQCGTTTIKRRLRKGTISSTSYSIAGLASTDRTIAEKSARDYLIQQGKLERGTQKGSLKGKGKKKESTK
ncbi:hypothetical protein Rt10032_c08g3498 [Rhodotorula toruloides]|uniref:Uncharacterized protein n=1 Tax=Rhodotorula toruloides TaxID=5286 RepID=A0A511KGI0_RHOTO|nr:hypothetical protein Rt10032_c08g3498 [Rhodotorula toruloides]